jgi:hypothetical protein
MTDSEIFAKAKEYAESQGCYAGACAAQLAAGFSYITDGYIAGYNQAMADRKLRKVSTFVKDSSKITSDDSNSNI